MPSLNTILRSLPFRRNANNQPDDGDDKKVENDAQNDDIEAQLSESDSFNSRTAGQDMPRFEYNPKNLLGRILVGINVKNKLDTSRIVRIPYRTGYKYALVIILLVIAAFLTPELIPRWLGFEWASPEDLCQNPDHKLDLIADKLRNLTKIDEARTFLSKQKHTLNCMNESGAKFYHGSDERPMRFQWPDECTSEIAQVSLTEQTCVSQNVNVCDTVGGVAGFFINLAGSCEQQVGPDVCVETTDANRTQALLELERDRADLKKNDLNTTKSEPIVATANSKVQQVVSRIIKQVDLASDAFILYSLVSIMVGVPLVVYKREKGSRIMGATFGMTKMSFVIVFVIVLTVYDSASLLMKETDFVRLFQNFLNDPCYVDPRFSGRRVALIVDACNNVSRVDIESEYTLQKMDGVFYDTRLFGFCKDGLRAMEEHPKLAVMDDIRTKYRLGNISNPGVCNSTKLDEETSIAPAERRMSKLQALLGSGVVAQLMLKFIVTSWLVHLIAFVEPMVMHNGKVEIWGIREDQTLGEEEQLAVTRFARDKHLLPLVIFSVLLVFEIILIFYGLATAVNGVGEIGVEKVTGEVNITNIPFGLTCPRELFP